MKEIPQSIILHDYFAMLGGGEKLVLTLADFLDCSLMGGFVDPEFINNAEFERKPASLEAYSGFTPFRILSLIHKWQNHQVMQTKNIIYSGVYAPLSVSNNSVRNILYCHTPPRFVYDKKDFYLSTLPVWQRHLFQVLITYFRGKYETAIPQMDLIVANSKHIQARIQTYLGLESTVIYPPCDTQRFNWQSQGDYYLSTARLDGLKRVEKIVRAFIKMPDKKLIVTSGGPEYQKLCLLARDAKNITFTNWIAQEKLYELVNNCIASIYIPHDEDFGISPVESMAAGKPVIGVNEGGLKETIVDQQTGALLNSSLNLEEQLITAIEILTPKRAVSLKDNCQLQAKKFSQEIFLEEMKKCLV